MRYGIDESSEVDEVSNRLGACAFSLDAGAGDRVKGHGENGAVKGQRSFHSDRLQTGKLSRRVDGRHSDVGGRGGRVS